VQGRFGAVLVTVTKIENEDSKAFGEVAPQIRNDLALARAKTEVQDIHDKIEDERAGGASLEDAAKKLNLPVITIDAVDRSGRDPAGKPLSSPPDAARIVSAAFASDIGVDNEPIEANGGYVWYEVTGITPAHDRPMDEVKAEVEQHWREDEIAARLKAKAAEILEKLKGGAPFDTVAAAEGLKVEVAANLKRGLAPGGGAISARMVEQIFRTPKDSYGSAQGDRPADWIVYRVNDIITPKLDIEAKDTKDIQTSVLRQLNDDVFGQYMGALEKDLGISVNQAALAQALGSGPPDTD